MEEINASQVVLKKDGEREGEGEAIVTAPLTKNVEEIAMVNTVEIEEGDEDAGAARMFNY